MHCRQWAARFALISMVAATGVGLLAGPAAADPDPSANPSAPPTEPGRDPAGEGDAHQLVITARGTTVTAGARKTGMLSVYNQGPNNVVDADFQFDLNALDTDKVDFQLLPNDACDAPGKASILCRSIGERTTLDLLFGLTPAQGAEPGPAGTITVVLKDSLHNGSEAPPHEFTFPVTVAPSGVDLLVWAPDQPFRADGTVGKIKRGADGTLSILIVNQGDQTVNGVQVAAKLVKGATFTDLDGCQVSTDRLTCTFTDLSLIPAAQDTDPDDEVWSAVEFTPGVHIADDAKSPKGWPDLPGNQVTVEPLAVEPATAKALRAATTLPVGVKGVSLAALDIDATDNTDDFTIMLAAADGSGTGGGSGGGSGGGLPITGAPAMPVAGVGVAALIFGAILMLLTRRRRVTSK